MEKLQKNAKISHTPLTQFLLMLIPYITMAHLSKIENQYHFSFNGQCLCNFAELKYLLKKFPVSGPWSISTPIFSPNWNTLAKELSKACFKISKKQATYFINLPLIWSHS